IRAFGFPVSPAFAAAQPEELTAPGPRDPIRILYIINTGKRKTGRALDRLLEIPNTQLTITVGRDAELKEKLVRRMERFKGRVRILGWTNEMPRLLMRHHLVVTKAGGATIQEAIAARCPMILNQIIPGQEDGNARLVLSSGIGAVALKNRDAAG